MSMDAQADDSFLLTVISMTSEKILHWDREVSGYNDTTMAGDADTVKAPVLIE